jgi:hypothetical protein
MRFRETLHPTKPTIVWFKIMRFSNGGGRDVMKVNVIPKFFFFESCKTQDQVRKEWAPIFLM